MVHRNGVCVKGAGEGQAEPPAPMVKGCYSTGIIWLTRNICRGSSLTLSNQ